MRLVNLICSPGAWCDARALQISWPGSYVEHGDLLFLLVHFVLVLLGYRWPVHLSDILSIVSDLFLLVLASFDRL